MWLVWLMWLQVGGLGWVAGGSWAQGNGGSSFKLRRKASWPIRWDKEKVLAFNGGEKVGPAALRLITWAVKAFGHGTAQMQSLGFNLLLLFCLFRARWKFPG